MLVPPDLMRRIIRLLAEQPIVASERDRRALLNLAGLPEELRGQIDLSGSPFVFLSNLVQLFADFPSANQAEDPLVAVLAVSHDLVGLCTK